MVIYTAAAGPHTSDSQLGTFPPPSTFNHGIRAQTFSEQTHQPHIYDRNTAAQEEAPGSMTGPQARYIPNHPPSIVNTRSRARSFPPQTNHPHDYNERTGAGHPNAASPHTQYMQSRRIPSPGDGSRNHPSPTHEYRGTNYGGNTTTHETTSYSPTGHQTPYTQSWQDSYPPTLDNRGRAQTFTAQGYHSGNHGREISTNEACGSNNPNAGPPTTGPQTSYMQSGQDTYHSAAGNGNRNHYPTAYEAPRYSTAGPQNHYMPSGQNPYPSAVNNGNRDHTAPPPAHHVADYGRNMAPPPPQAPTPPMKNPEYAPSTFTSNNGTIPYWQPPHGFPVPSSSMPVHHYPVMHAGQAYPFPSPHYSGVPASHLAAPTGYQPDIYSNRYPR